MQNISSSYVCPLLSRPSSWRILITASFLQRKKNVWCSLRFNAIQWCLTITNQKVTGTQIPNINHFRNAFLPCTRSTLFPTPVKKCMLFHIIAEWFKFLRLLVTFDGKFLTLFTFNMLIKMKNNFVIICVDRIMRNCVEIAGTKTLRFANGKIELKLVLIIFSLFSWSVLNNEFDRKPFRYFILLAFSIRTTSVALKAARTICDGAPDRKQRDADFMMRSIEWLTK